MTDWARWLIIRGDKIHVACLEPEETLLTIMYGTEECKDACPRCGIPLNEVPDP